MPASQERRVESVANEREGIAIIGMSGAFAKAKDVDEFWQNLAQGRDCITEVPQQRWSIEQLWDADPQVAGKSYSRWMGALDEADRFDPSFFNITPAEAEWMDPQQRLFLQHCWSCLEDAGVKPGSLSGSRCGVYVGCGPGDYVGRAGAAGLSAQGLMGGSASILAARISYFLNLKGACLAIDTACSSSLVAVAQACDSLMLGRNELALAGGVCVLSGPGLHIMASKAGMLSRQGRCYSFDARADGFVPAEGVGVVLLKPLRAAIRDRDVIHGVIRGWGVNQDGRTNGITAPSVNSQVALQKEIYERFGIDPQTISLVEAHGTGTMLGDPIEVEALTEAFRSYTRDEGYCALGSVKSNIGHPLAAAGMAGLIKVLLALQHGKLPPTIHFERLNEHIVLDSGPFYINTQLRPWQTDRARCAAVSSFGFSGTNAQVVIEEHRAAGFSAQAAGGPVLLVLSGKTEEQLRSYARRVKAHLEREPLLELADIAYTLQVGREAMDHRLAFVVQTQEQALASLEGYIDGKPLHQVFVGQMKTSKEGVAVFESDEDVGSLLQAWMRKSKLTKLAELWVKGLNIEWSELYVAGCTPRRISLPTYPFAGLRYWVSNDDRMAEPLGGMSATECEREPAEQNADSVPRPATADRRRLTLILPADLAERSEAAATTAETLIEELATSLAEALYFGRAEVDVDKRFVDMGLDSIISVEWMRTVNSRYQVTLSAAQLYDYQTVRALATFMESVLHARSLREAQ